MRSPWAVPGDDRIEPNLIPPDDSAPEEDPDADSHGLDDPYGFEVCPECRSTNLSYDGPGWMADLAEGQPDTPLVCENCGWTGRQEEAL